MRDAEKTKQGRKYLLRLYNANRTGEMKDLAKRFEAVMNEHFPSRASVEVVDVISEPERAAEDKVFVTPTIVKALPEPIQRVIGDVSDPNKILMLLGVFSVDKNRPEKAEDPDQ